MSCIGTVIQNYFNISSASYTSSVIPCGFIYNIRTVASETLHVLLENRAWRILSRPPGYILRVAILVDAQAASVLMMPTHRISLQQGYRSFHFKNKFLGRVLLKC